MAGVVVCVDGLIRRAIGIWEGCLASDHSCVVRRQFGLECCSEEEKGISAAWRCLFTWHVELGGNKTTRTGTEGRRVKVKGMTASAGAKSGWSEQVWKASMIKNEGLDKLSYRIQ